MADGSFLDLAFVSEQLETRRGSMLSGVPNTVGELKALKKEILNVRYGNAEKAFLIKALTAAEGNITAAAKRVGMQRANFSTLMKKHSLRAIDFKPERQTTS
jgi:transcriptional regulator of acetoin/glycerol metabolism